MGEHIEQRRCRRDEKRANRAVRLVLSRSKAGADETTLNHDPVDPRLVRVRHRISQRLLARIAGISQNQVTRIETGSGPVGQGARNRYTAALLKLQKPAVSPRDTA